MYVEDIYIFTEREREREVRICVGSCMNVIMIVKRNFAEKLSKRETREN